MFDKLNKHLESPEGKESVKAFFAKMDTQKLRLKNHIESFHAIYHNRIDEVMERLMRKYDSYKYREKERRLGYEAREDLFWFMLAYAEKYGSECKDEQYWNTFTGSAYYIGSYVIQVMHGQGSVIRIDKQITPTKISEPINTWEWFFKKSPMKLPSETDIEYKNRFYTWSRDNFNPPTKKDI